MTDILRPGQLPEIAENFAIEHGGEPWRNRMIGAVATHKTVMSLDQNASTTIGFRARLSRESDASPWVASYDFIDGKTEVLEELPDDLRELCEELGIEVVRDEGDILGESHTTTWRLKQAVPEATDQPWMIHEHRQLEYSVNGRAFLAGHLYGEALVLDEPPAGEVEAHVYDSPGLGLALMRYFLRGEPEPEYPTDELAALFSEDGIFDPVEEAAHTMLQGITSLQGTLS